MSEIKVLHEIGDYFPGRNLSEKDQAIYEQQQLKKKETEEDDK